MSELIQKIEDLQGSEWGQIAKNGSITVEENTLQTNIAGVYAIGDAASGASDIITAVASGKRAATSIDKKISGENAVDLLGLAADRGMPPAQRAEILSRWAEHLRRVGRADEAAHVEVRAANTAREPVPEDHPPFEVAPAWRQ